MSRLVCQGCNTASGSVKQWGNHGVWLCDRCLAKAKLHPEHFVKIGHPRLKLKTERTEPAFKDTWEHRKAMMHPQHSEMERVIQLKLHSDVELRDAGWKVRGPKKHCLVWTEDDGGLVKGDRDVPYYLDHVKTHKNRQEKDLELRGLLQKRIGVEPIVASYKTNSKKEQERVFGLIKEALA